MPRGVTIDEAWLREHYPKMSDIDELLDDYEREFGSRPSKTAVYCKANRLGIRKRPVANRDGRAERAVRWSREPEMEAWMLEHDHGQRVDALSDEFRGRFGFGLSRGQVDSFRASHGMQRRKSHGGGRPRVPVGTERRSKDGYVVVKVREEASVPMSKDNWVLKHVHVYEQVHGPVPDGHSVYFADGDKSNFDPANLVAVPHRLVGVMSALRSEGVTWHDADSLRAVMALARLRVARNEALARQVRICACCGREYTNESRLKAGNVGAAVCPECGRKGRKPPTGVRRKYDHDLIRDLHAKGMRNEQIADAVGCTRSTVSSVIRGRTGRGKKR